MHCRHDDGLYEVPVNKKGEPCEVPFFMSYERSSSIPVVLFGKVTFAQARTSGATAFQQMTTTLVLQFDEELLAVLTHQVTSKLNCHTMDQVPL